MVPLGLPMIPRKLAGNRCYGGDVVNLLATSTATRRHLLPALASGPSRPNHGCQQGLPKRLSKPTDAGPRLSVDYRVRLIRA
jgi:hypothetical protein